MDYGRVLLFPQGQLHGAAEILAADEARIESYAAAVRNYNYAGLSPEDAAAIRAANEEALAVQLKYRLTPVQAAQIAETQAVFKSDEAGVAAAQEAERIAAQQAAAAAAAQQAAATQSAKVNTTTATVQHVDTASGTTSTADAKTGVVQVTTATGQTVTGAGGATANGVTTTVNTNTGVVTTQNANTGVVTHTNATTGQTQTATQVTGTAGGGGTFMLPDGKTVTTDKSITATGVDAGKLALVGLLGLLLLRGAIK